MKTTSFNEDIDRAVWGVCDMRPECTKMHFRNRIFFDQKKKNIELRRLIILMNKQRYLKDWKYREDLALTDLLIFQISIST